MIVAAYALACLILAVRVGKWTHRKLSARWLPDPRVEAVAEVDRALDEHFARMREEANRCIHGGECGDPLCLIDGSDER